MSSGMAEREMGGRCGAAGLSANRGRVVGPGESKDLGIQTPGVELGIGGQGLGERLRQAS